MRTLLCQWPSRHTTPTFLRVAVGIGRCSSGTSLRALSASAWRGMRAGFCQWPSPHTTPTFLRVAVHVGSCSSGTSLLALSASAWRGMRTGFGQWFGQWPSRHTTPTFLRVAVQMGRCSSGTSLLALSASASGGMRAGFCQWPSRHTTPTFLRVAVHVGSCSSGTSLLALSASAWRGMRTGFGQCKDGKVFLWDLTAGTVRQRLEGHADWVLSVAFSPHDANVLASGSSDGKIVLCGAPVVNIILSVRFDVDSFSPYAAHVTEFLRKVYNVRVYNPNNFNKRYCGHDGCCVLSYGCQIAFDPTQTPTNSDCWQSSYRWHCEGRGSWCRANLPVVMLAIVEDGVLGPGQKTEKRMAEQMGIQRLEVHTKKLYIGQLGGAELDKALLDVANLLRGLKFI
ncbi:unnamed protein product [Prorocentrum cordatum]|uniref:Uncharacterized protein n=1 Tax=Prorocentrum cordatum TaxID=2364126 RepID=A0ABN9VRA3_9DINO|nr:unnamed protein product [Polarella glacialis]